jgi:hypothetical protein
MRIRKVERFEVGQKRTAVAARNLSLVLSAITLVLIVITAAFLSQGTGFSSANPNVQSSSLGSSSVSSSSVIQPVVQSPLPYPLVWAPNSPTVCVDQGECFIDAMLALSNGTSSTASTSSTTTLVSNSTTTLVHGFTTIIIRTNTVTVSCQPLANGTLATNHTSSVTSTSCTSSVTTNVERDGIYGSPSAFLTAYVTAYVRDAVTGQNVTTSSGLTVITYGCGIPLTGFTHCLIGGHVPPGHTYKVTLFVTKTYLPCSLRPVNHPNLPCTLQLLAPPSLTVTGDF